MVEGNAAPLIIPPKIGTRAPLQMQHRDPGAAKVQINFDLRIFMMEFGGLAHKRSQKIQINLKGPYFACGSELVVQPFSPTLLVEVEYDQHKYRGCFHLSTL